MQYRSCWCGLLNLCRVKQVPVFVPPGTSGGLLSFCLSVTKECSTAGIKGYASKKVGEGMLMNGMAHWPHLHPSSR